MKDLQISSSSYTLFYTKHLKLRHMRKKTSEIDLHPSEPPSLSLFTQGSSLWTTVISNGQKLPYLASKYILFALYHFLSLLNLLNILLALMFIGFVFHKANLARSNLVIVLIDMVLSYLNFRKQKLLKLSSGKINSWQKAWCWVFFRQCLG